MERPSTMQRKVYEKLCGIVTSTGDVPNLSDLARDMGVTYMTLQQHLKALARKGYLSFESRGRGRSPIVKIIRLGIPVFGNITAGSLVEQLQEPEGYLAMYGVGGQDLFALRVDGDSMADLIQDNDIVIVKPDQPVRPGHICAVKVNELTTLKYVEWEGSTMAGGVVLRPHNPDYPAVTLDRDDVEINGVYQGLLRGELIHAFYRDAGVA